ncbi:MAG: nucleotide exchange factor GrpE [Solirubrobacterales bacterium]|nr:nucleotide exchange factor GrpE [Solirubrobacterales bacterium]
MAEKDDTTAAESPSAAGPGADRPAADPAAPGREAEEAAGGDSGVEVANDLDALLEDVKRERDEYLDLARRAKADFENYRKRAAREAADAERRGKAALARQLVPSIDNLERALAVADEGSEVARGVGLVHGELQATLARAGVESYDPSGERFDPTLHEAISTMPATDEVEPGTVVETLERGYRLNGQVLRPARVVVSE